MAEAGADVACADIDAESARATAAVVQGLGRRGTAIGCDVTVEAEVEAMVRRTVEVLGRLDILFNNAGIADPQALLLHQYPTADWRAVLDVDLDGVFFCAREALKVMVVQQSGKIINIASMWGLAGSSSLFPALAYNAAKGAVVNLTRELGLEYARQGIQVNALCPGFYQTNLSRGAIDDPQGPCHDHCLHPDGPDRRGRRDQRAGALPRLSRVRLHDRTDPGSRWRLPGKVTGHLTPADSPAA